MVHDDRAVLRRARRRHAGEKYAFKPTNGEFEEVRTFGEQVKHVACINFGFFNEIEKREPPEAAAPAGHIRRRRKPRCDVPARVVRLCRPRAANHDAGQRARSGGGPYGGKSTRLGLTTLAVWHASDHYGQLVVYLRMNGIVPPASRPAPAEPASRRRRRCSRTGAGTAP